MYHAEKYIGEAVLDRKRWQELKTRSQTLQLSPVRNICSDIWATGSVSPLAQNN
jgi:hypothetical protein